MTTLYPIRDRIVVKKAEELKQTASGLYIPETSAERPDRGVVVAVGSGRVNPDGTVVPMEVEVGDTVVFQNGFGQLVKVNGEEFLVMNESDILARVK